MRVVKEKVTSREKPSAHFLSLMFKPFPLKTTGVLKRVLFKSKRVKKWNCWKRFRRPSCCYELKSIVLEALVSKYPRNTFSILFQNQRVLWFPERNMTVTWKTKQATETCRHEFTWTISENFFNRSILERKSAEVSKSENDSIFFSRWFFSLFAAEQYFKEIFIFGSILSTYKNLKNENSIY